ncbi:MAG TPA: dihydroxy-acid dehydratase [Rubrobacteraceae bacterium]|nr:dihydroxy-acid dehydratase [Rubrobacteraceae bacterium]
MPAPRIGVLSTDVSDLADRIREMGGEPVPPILPSARPKGGIALAREWVADAAHISCSHERLDALLVADEEPEDLAGLVLASLRLNLPTVAHPPPDASLFAALAALGLAPLAADPAELVVEVAENDGARPRKLVEDFSLANALRAAYSLGAGPQTMVHLAAIARELGSLGFDQMLRILVPETTLLAEPGSPWFEEHGVAGLLAHLGQTLHETWTVEGGLREVLPSAPPAPPTSDESRLIFVRGRASGTEALCRVTASDEEITGECRVHYSEDSAARAVEGGSIAPGSLLVVGGCGPRGAPGLSRLDRLAEALRESGLEGSIPVMTDGLPPRETRETWISLVSPEAARESVIGRLRSGDSLRMDLLEGRIRTGVKAGELEGRKPYELPRPTGASYAARYARSALPALEGAGFG